VTKLIIVVVSLACN